MVRGFDLILFTPLWLFGNANTCIIPRCGLVMFSIHTKSLCPSVTLIRSNVSFNSGSNSTTYYHPSSCVDGMRSPIISSACMSHSWFARVALGTLVNFFDGPMLPAQHLVKFHMAKQQLEWGTPRPLNWGPTTVEHLPQSLIFFIGLWNGLGLVFLVVVQCSI